MASGSGSSSSSSNSSGISSLYDTVPIDPSVKKLSTPCLKKLETQIKNLLEGANGDPPGWVRQSALLKIQADVYKELKLREYEAANPKKEQPVDEIAFWKRINSNRNIQVSDLEAYIPPSLLTCAGPDAKYFSERNHWRTQGERRPNQYGLELPSRSELQAQPIPQSEYENQLRVQESKEEEYYTKLIGRIPPTVNRAALCISRSTLGRMRSKTPNVFDCWKIQEFESPVETTQVSHASNYARLELPPRSNVGLAKTEEPFFQELLNRPQEPPKPPQHYRYKLDENPLPVPGSVRLRKALLSQRNLELMGTKSAPLIVLERRKDSLAEAQSDQQKFAAQGEVFNETGRSCVIESGVSEPMVTTHHSEDSLTEPFPDQQIFESEDKDGLLLSEGTSEPMDTKQIPLMALERSDDSLAETDSCDEFSEDPEEISEDTGKVRVDLSDEVSQLIETKQMPSMASEHSDGSFAEADSCDEISENPEEISEKTGKARVDLSNKISQLIESKQITSMALEHSDSSFAEADSCDEISGNPEEISEKTGKVRVDLSDEISQLIGTKQMPSMALEHSDGSFAEADSYDEISENPEEISEKTGKARGDLSNKISQLIDSKQMPSMALEHSDSSFAEADSCDEISENLEDISEKTGKVRVNLSVEIPELIGTKQMPSMALERSDGSFAEADSYDEISENPEEISEKAGKARGDLSNKISQLIDSKQMPSMALEHSNSSFAEANSCDEISETPEEISEKTGKVPVNLSVEIPELIGTERMPLIALEHSDSSFAEANACQEASADTADISENTSKFHVDLSEETSQLLGAAQLSSEYDLEIIGAVEKDNLEEAHKHVVSSEEASEPIVAEQVALLALREDDSSKKSEWAPFCWKV